MESIIKIGDFPEELQRRIDREYRCVDVKTALGDDVLRTALRGIIIRSNCELPGSIIERLPSLRVISICGVGYDGLPVAAAQERGIIVTHTPGVLDAAVCELGIGLLLGLLRQIPQADRYVRQGVWQTQGGFPLATSLHGLKVGIVGMGRIGNGIARRLEPFGVELAYAGGRAQIDRCKAYPSVQQLAENVDVLILCCKGGEETRHLVDAKILRALGAGWLINMSRGSVVKEDDLCRALKDGNLRGAALDVFEQEPLGDSMLRSLPNVLLSPHAGSATHASRAAMLDLTLQNLREVLAGNPAVTPTPLLRGFQA